MDDYEVNDYYSPPLTGGGGGAPWGSLLSTFGNLGGKFVDYRIAKDIDAERQRNFLFTDPAGAQWMVGPDGRMYGRGLPMTSTGGIPPLFIILAAGGLVLFLALR